MAVLRSRGQVVARRRWRTAGAHLGSISSLMVATFGVGLVKNCLASRRPVAANAAGGQQQRRAGNI